MLKFPLARSLWTLGFAFLLVVLACDPSRATSPNVVIIVVDTLRADHMSAYGYPRRTTPEIERFSAGAVRFDQAMSVTSWTTPSIGALLTSRYPTEVSPEYPPAALPRHVLRLPQLFQHEGYVTGAVVSHLFIGRRLGFDVGFDVFDEEEARGPSHISSPGVTDRALAFVEKHQRDSFFLFAHYFDPHYDFLRHEQHDFAGEPIGRVRSGMPIHVLNEIGPELTEAELEYIRGLYDSEIALTDEHIGRLLRRLRELDLYDDSLIVITGDHGEEFLERGVIGHGNHLHAESIRVPLIVKPPGWKEGRVVRTPVSLIDVGRTVCALSGVAWPTDTLGRGRTLPLVNGDGEESHAVISELGSARSIITGRWKLLTADSLGGARLYDWTTDSGERDNVISSHPQIAESLALRLERWADTLKAESDGIPVEFSGKERQRLRALGYLQ